MRPPEPYTYHCPDCGWRKTLAPKSDALMPGEVFSRCANCTGENLRREQATGLERALTRFRRRLGR